MHVSHSYAGDTDSACSNLWSLIRAAEVFRHSLATLVDEHLDGDGQHEVDVEGLDLDGGAKAESSVEVGHAGQQRVRESWTKGSSGVRPVSHWAGLMGYEDMKTEDYTRVRIGLSLTWKAS